MERTLLLVDDEEYILSALNRVFRREGYRILRADGAAAGLALLGGNDVGVIIADQRMPGMTGVEFFSQVKERYPDTIRIMLSGFTELESVTAAINRGAIYKFLTKPWEDDLLRSHVGEAFEYYEWRLESKRVSRELQHAKQDLEKKVARQGREVKFSLKALQTAHGILDELPAVVLGVSADGDIAMANRRAREVLGDNGISLLGQDAGSVLPPKLWAACERLSRQDDPTFEPIELVGRGCFELRCRRFTGEGRGMIVLLTESQG